MSWSSVLTNLVVVVIIMATVQLAKKSASAAALLISLPITTIIAMIVMRVGAKVGDDPGLEKMGFFSTATFWYVLPSLPMFLVMPWLFRKGMGFWPALGIGCVLTALLYYLTMFLLKKYAGMEL